MHIDPRFRPHQLQDELKIMHFTKYQDIQTSTIKHNLSAQFGISNGLKRKWSHRG